MYFIYRDGLREASKAILDRYALSICFPDRSGMICPQWQLKHKEEEKYLMIYNGQSHLRSGYVRIPNINGEL